MLNANASVKSYWIKVECGVNYQLAILEYEGSTDEEPTTVVTDGTIFNFGGVVSCTITSNSHLDLINDIIRKMLQLNNQRSQNTNDWKAIHVYLVLHSLMPTKMLF